MITIFKNIKETKNPFFIDLDKVYERIKDGNSKYLIEQIRVRIDKKERNKIKQNLPSICFSGEFEERANDKIKKHSGYVCLDFDHLDDSEAYRKTLIKDKYICMAFISPSGDGLKVVVKIPADIKTHAESCRALKEYFKNEKLDSFEDVARVCYESYDPLIYYNKDSEVYKGKIKIEFEKIKKREITVDATKIFEKLKTWIEKKEAYADGNKHTFLVKFAGALNRFGVSQENSNNLLISNYQNKASYVKSTDIEKIVSRIYNKYLFQYNISQFEETGVSIDRKTDKKLTGEFFNEYVEVATESYMEKLEKDRFVDTSQKPEKPPVYLSIFDKKTDKYIKVQSAGNISLIQGRQKSKKTFVASLFAGALIENAAGNYTPFIDLISTLPENKDTVIYFDTEQAKYDAWKVATRSEKLSRTTADNFATYRLRGLEPKFMMQFIEHVIRKYGKYIGVVFIDQIADLVNSLNDEQEGRKVVRLIESLTEEYDIHICCIIHQNKLNDFAQGWLGTQIMKKAENITKATKNEEDSRVSRVTCLDSRGDLEFPEFDIYIKNDGMPEVCEPDKYIPQVNISDF